MKKTVPLKSLFQVGGAFQLAEGDGKAEANQKFVPFKMLARSPNPIDHWFFGQEVHDFAGMTHRDRIAVDWMHDPDQLIGFANKFTVDAQGLWIEGAITSTQEGDRASIVIGQARAEIPLEASIQFTPRMPGDTKIEEIAAGDEAEANGMTIHGPATIFREWPLVRVAVVASGADADTATHIQSASGTSDVDVECVTKETGEMTEAEKAKAEEERKNAEAAEADAAKASADSELAAGRDVDTAGAEAGAAEEHVDGGDDDAAAKDAADGSDGRAELKAYIAEFGTEQGATLYLAEKPIDEARKEALAAVLEENKNLKAQLESRDGAAGVDADMGDEGETRLTAAEEAAARTYAKSIGVKPDKYIAQKLARKIKKQG